MARRRRRKSSRSRWIAASLVIIAGVWTYGHFVSPVLEGSRPAPPTVEDKHVTSGVQPAATPFAEAPRLTSTRPETSDGGAGRDVAEKGASPAPASAKPPDPERAKRAASLFSAGMQALQDGALVAARAHLSEAVGLGLAAQELLDARAALTRVGAETIFGPTVYADDPFVSRHTIAPGETLAKIAKRYNVTADFLAALNNIADKNRVRAGQAIKIVHGPFHARIQKKSYSLDIYLQETFVKHYTVGLGKDSSTPTGEWLVGTKLENPTYYPPRSGQIIAADDPDNPLGERWIELKGIAGNAVGQERYGIHGTNEPDSIGKSMSLGCVRMHNADVMEVYTYLVSDKSHVHVTE